MIMIKFLIIGFVIMNMNCQSEGKLISITFNVEGMDIRNGFL